ncbi:hypothetical protein BD779DRAFT_1801237 [Infundibulicybe gibba]|nr:hypothetical protein BD779DRAFT_1801237 [Infundibulicybe gibba]
MYPRGNPPQTSPQVQQQPSPTISNPRRPLPTGAQIQSPQPTPSYPNPPSVQDSSGDRSISLPPPPQHSHSVNYPRPIHRKPPQFLNYRNEEHWEMSDELLAEIERTNMQQARSPVHPSQPRDKSAPPLKAESVRVSGQTSPEVVNISRRLRRQREQASRDNPKGRDRRPTLSNTLPERSSPRYEGHHSGRDSRSGHQKQHEQDDSEKRSVLDHPSDDEDSFTPRSPSVCLPDAPPNKYYTPQNSKTVRGRTRNGAIDQLGLRGLDSALFKPNAPTSTTEDHAAGHPTQYVDQHKPTPKAPQAYQQIPASFINPRVAQSQLYPQKSTLIYNIRRTLCLHLTKPTFALRVLKPRSLPLLIAKPLRLRLPPCFQECTELAKT